MCRPPRVGGGRLKGLLGLAGVVVTTGARSHAISTVEFSSPGAFSVPDNAVSAICGQA
jgi:hypothetical protein